MTYPTEDRHYHDDGDPCCWDCHALRRTHPKEEFDYSCISRNCPQVIIEGTYDLPDRG